MDRVSSQAFREALAHFASGVTVVAARPPSGLVGFTATGFTSVSLSPPLILVCIDHVASAHDGVVGADHFGVSILDEGQSWIATQFARSGVDRFEGIPLAAPGPSGVPLIEGALARIECRRHARHVAGDHTILVGEVVGAAVSAGRPLLHFARVFGVFVAGGHKSQ
jgi:flavin reductase (DIM6/NTAB) family NADH-FMN oxidoreductase RutF